MGKRISEFTGANLLFAAGQPALLLHSRDDTEVPFACAETIAHSNSRVTLRAFDNLGHRAILYALPVVRAAAKFLDEFANAR